MMHLLMANIIARNWFAAAVACLMLACRLTDCSAEEVDWKATLDASFKQIETREFSPVVAGEWKGRGIGYGPYRVGQALWGPLPTEDELTEDLQILARDWDLIRLYGSVDPTEAILQIIRDKKLPLRVMVGAWITRRTPSRAIHPARRKLRNDRTTAKSDPQFDWPTSIQIKSLR